MTVIVGLENMYGAGKAWLGADSQGTCGNSRDVRYDRKLFVREDLPGERFVFGFTTSYRFGQLLRYDLSLPGVLAATPDDPDAELEALVKHLVPAVRTTLKSGGYTKVENNQEEGGIALLGWRGRVYMIGGDFQIGRSQHGIMACGCGSEHARAALMVTDGLSLPTSSETMPPQDRIFEALRITEELNVGVSGPFILEWA